MTLIEILSYVIILFFLCIVCSNRKKNKLKKCNEEYARTQQLLLNKIKEFEIFIDAIPGYVWQKDKNGAIVAANKQTCAALGISKTDIVGKTVRDLFPPGLAKKLATQDQQFLNGKITTLQTEDFSPFSSNKKFISTRMNVVKNEDNQITGIIGIGLDVTKLKIIEEKLLYSKAYLKVVLDIAINFVNIPLPEIDEAIIEALALAGNFSMADRAVLLSYNSDTRTICCTHEWLGPVSGRSHQKLKNLPLAGSLHWIESHLSKEHLSILCIQKLPEDDALRQILTDLRIKSIITSPLLHASRCIGFVGFASAYSEKKWSKNESELLRLMSELLINAKLRQEHDLHLIRAKATAEAAYETIEARIQKRTQELATANALLQRESAERIIAISNLNLIQSAISLVLIAVNAQGKVFRWGERTELVFGIKPVEAEGTLFQDIPVPWDWETVTNSVQACLTSGQKTQAANVEFTRRDGSKGFLMITVNPMVGAEAPGYLILGEDVTEIRTLENRLAQSAKLEAIGQLAAGIAHEINTPAQYVSDSVTFLKDVFTNTIQFIDMLKAHYQEGMKPDCVTSSKLYSILSSLDLEFSAPEVPDTFDRIFDGMARISSIVQAMNRFSYGSGSIKTEVNVNSVIENTITISRNEWKHIADLKTDLDPNIKTIIGQANEIGQVFLNIIINATHAISEAARNTSRRGVILITSKNIDDGVKISIQDNGAGIPSDIHDKIFNLFFTTKTIGNGTGQGLAIAYDIVVKKHFGRIFFTSEAGHGTTFHVIFPFASTSTDDHGTEDSA